MTDAVKDNVFDLAFIGGGLSTLYTLIGIMDALEKHPNYAPPLKIAIIDRIGDFGQGIPYGSMGADGLLLLPAQYMLPGKEENAFISFLREKKSLWFEFVKSICDARHYLLVSAKRRKNQERRIFRYLFSALCFWIILNGYGRCAAWTDRPSW